MSDNDDDDQAAVDEIRSDPATTDGDDAYFGKIDTPVSKNPLSKPRAPSGPNNLRGKGKRKKFDIPEDSNRIAEKLHQGFEKAAIIHMLHHEDNRSVHSWRNWWRRNQSAIDDAYERQANVKRKKERADGKKKATENAKIRNERESEPRQPIAGTSKLKEKARKRPTPPSSDDEDAIPAHRPFEAGQKRSRIEPKTDSDSPSIARSMPSESNLSALSADLLYRALRNSKKNSNQQYTKKKPQKAQSVSSEEEDNADDEIDELQSTPPTAFASRRAGPSQRPKATGPEFESDSESDAGPANAGRSKNADTSLKPFGEPFQAKLTPDTVRKQHSQQRFAPRVAAVPVSEPVKELDRPLSLRFSDPLEGTRQKLPRKPIATSGGRPERRDVLEDSAAGKVNQIGDPQSNLAVKASTSTTAITSRPPDKPQSLSSVLREIRASDFKAPAGNSLAMKDVVSSNSDSDGDDEETPAAIAIMMPDAVRQQRNSNKGRKEPREDESSASDGDRTPRQSAAQQHPATAEEMAGNSSDDFDAAALLTQPPPVESPSRIEESGVAGKGPNLIQSQATQLTSMEIEDMEGGVAVAESAKHHEKARLRRAAKTDGLAMEKANERIRVGKVTKSNAFPSRGQITQSSDESQDDEGGGRRDAKAPPPLEPSPTLNVVIGGAKKALPVQKGKRAERQIKPLTAEQTRKMVSGFGTKPGKRITMSDDSQSQNQMQQTTPASASKLSVHSVLPSGFELEKADRCITVKISELREFFLIRKDVGVPTERMLDLWYQTSGRPDIADLSAQPFIALDPSDIRLLQQCFWNKADDDVLLAGEQGSASESGDMERRRGLEALKERRDFLTSIGVQ